MTIENLLYRQPELYELEQLLAGVGFRVAGMFDNKELRETDLSGPRLYVAAIR